MRIYYIGKFFFTVKKEHCYRNRIIKAAKYVCYVFIHIITYYLFTFI